MTQFPNSPSIGDRVTFNDATYEWDGNRWKSLGTIAVGPTGPAGATGEQGPAGGGGGGGTTLAAGAGVTLTSIVAGVGHTLGIDPNATIYVDGISADGATFNGNVEVADQITSSVGSGTPKIQFSTSTGSSILLRPAGNTALTVSNTEVDIPSNRTLHVNGPSNFEGLSHFKSGVSSDAGITVGGEIRTTNGKFYNSTSDTGIDVSNASQANIRIGGSARWSVGNISVSTPVKLIVSGDTETRSLLHVYEGISMDAAGITFPDGTFQSSAASGSGIDPTSVIRVAGVSSGNAGVTTDKLYSSEYGHYIEMNRASDKIGIRPQGALQYTFGVSQFYSGVGSNSMAGNLSVDGLAHVKAGISCDGGVTVGGELKVDSDIVFNGGSRIQNDSVTRNSYIYFEDGNDGTIRFRPDNMPALSVTRAAGVIVNSQEEFKSEPIANFLSGVSASGATFAGLIVADGGITVDGGITASGNIKTAGRLVGDIVQSEDNELSRYGYVANDSRFDIYTGNNDARLYASSFGIQAPNGAIQANTYLEAGTYVHAGTGVSSDGGITAAGDLRTNSQVSVNGHKLLRNSSSLQYNINNRGANITFGEWGSGIFESYLEAGSYVQAGTYVHAGTGVSLDAGGITFPDGTFQSTAASGSGGSSTQKYSMGFFYDGRGSNLSTGYISDIVRNVEQGATATKVTVYYPTAVTATAGVELYKVGTSYFNSPGASFEANGTLIAGVSVDSGDYGASAGIAVALAEDDMVFGRLTNSGHTDKLQVFLKYESSS